MLRVMQATLSPEHLAGHCLVAGHEGCVNSRQLDSALRNTSNATHAGDSDATAASLATAFAAGGSTAQSYAAAVAQAIAQNGCGPYQATLASAH